MEAAEVNKQLHVCGHCEGKFTDEPAYLNHTCSTGFAPTDEKHMETLDPNFAKVSKAAQLRGAGRRILENDGVPQDKAKVIMAGVATENQAVSKIKKSREGGKKEKAKPLPQETPTAPPLEPLP